MKSKTLIVATLLITIAALFFYSRRPQPVEVEAYSLAEGEVRATVANTRVGTVKACRRAYLAPATGGQVAELRVKEGDKVKQGQVLLEVWNQDLKAQVVLQKAQINASRASAEQACQLAGGAEREAARMTQLQKHKNVVSVEQVDKSVTGGKSQRAACRAAQQAIEVAEAQLGVAEAAVQRTLVKAPFDGTVAEVNAELGEFVTPSPPGIPTLPPIDLLDVSCLTVSAPIDEVDAASIKTGMSACVSLDAFPDKRCSGIVTRVAPYVLEKEKQARTVEVEVTLRDPKDLAELLPGYSADIEVLLSQKEHTLRLPAEAILENHRVLLIAEDNVLHEQSFQPGLSNWSFTEVLSGLKAGDKVVTSVGKEGVAAGVTVRVKP
ncbi:MULTISPECIES: efflux RND transporter periplasmic adaptor subunit [Methylomonas]|uniref:Efflux transporter periplasmic adaptor subunit n=2 Tax=Methylomonas TaxID=416 RepID=A0A126T3W9_9GAMM|nr:MULTISPECIES: efflux RND transporter periplasmic adaptor subunit [Methylomonas]AMK76785.1 efflux transporter periplasmic adaptor subunit [Methylomonas denitrificans]OAH96359.1 efflux transporter periplasmic adaptor subunit [Methylomonas methanica]TCV75222.1 HlyD family secretion protein [Methylomonas methanica]